MKMPAGSKNPPAFFVLILYLSPTQTKTAFL
jgi:hypothetical protein